MRVLIIGESPEEYLAIKACLGTLSYPEIDLTWHKTSADAVSTLAPNSTPQVIAEERNLLRSLIDAVPDFIYAKDLEHRLILDNLAHARSIGLDSPDDACGRTDAEFFPTAMVEHFYEDDDRVIQTGKPVINREELSLGKDGNVILASTTKVPLYNLKGELIGLVGSTRDITAHKLYEESMKRSQADLQSIIDSTSLAFILLNTEGKIRVVNQLAQEYVYRQYQRVLEIGSDIADFLPYELIAYHRDYFETVMQGESRIFEQRVMVYDQQIFYEYRYYPVKTSDNAVVGVCISCEDITLRRQSETILQQTKDQLQAILDYSPSNIFMKNLAGEIILLNRRAAVDSGVTIDEVYGKPEQEIFPTDLASHFDGQDQRVLELRNPITYEENLMGRTYLKTKFPIYDQQNEIYAIGAIATEITQRVVYEQTLERALEQQKELNELKSRFISIASHEFRTPLATILASVETIDAYRHRMDDTQIVKRLNKIRDQVQHMKVLLEDILQLSRMQAGRVDFAPIETDLDAFLLDIIEEFEIQPENRSRIIYTCIPKPLVVPVDTKLMRQIMGNLLTNAFKYSKDKQPVFLEVTQQPTYLMIQVRDQGIGIPEEDMAHLFEPFHRATNIGTISGTGMGLAITKQAVDIHGGTIDISSHVNYGTTVTVNIPVQSS